MKVCWKLEVISIKYFTSIDIKEYNGTVKDHRQNNTDDSKHAKKKVFLGGILRGLEGVDTGRWRFFLESKVGLGTVT